MSLDSIKKGWKELIEQNKAKLEAWESVTYLTKKDGSAFKSMSRNFKNATYKRESFRGNTLFSLEVDTKFTKNYGISYVKDQIDCGDKDKPNTLEEIKEKVSETIVNIKYNIEFLETQLEMIDYAYKEFSKSYNDLRNDLKDLCGNNIFLASMICKDIVKRQNYW